MQPTKEQIQRFISLGYATDALKFAKFDCEQLPHAGSMTSMAYFSGITSLVTHYARPFKRSRGLPTIEESFIPTEYLALHRHLIEARDKAHAHLDGDLGDPAVGQLCHQIRLLKQRDAQHFWIPARLLTLEPETITKVRTLIDRLLVKLDAETDQLESLLLPFIAQLKTGLYLLSTETPYFLRDVRNDGIEAIGEIVTLN